MSRLLPGRPRPKQNSQRLRQRSTPQPQEEMLFRRSRTLTGSTSSGVRAVNEKKAELKSDRIKKHALKKTRHAIMGALVVILLITGALYYLISQYTATVEVYAYSPDPVKPPPSQQYKKQIEAYLGARPTERFRFALKTHDLTRYLQQDFPEIDALRLDGGHLGSAKFTVTLRQPIASWQIGTRQFFVDSSGEAFEHNYFASPSVNVIDKSGAALGANNTLASRGFLRFLGRLVALTDASGLGRVREAVLPPGTTREVDIKLEGRGYSIKTHTDRDPATEVEDLRRVVAYLEAHKLNPVYIDLRVIGKAFYR